jgi:hypothetical protein
LWLDPNALFRCDTNGVHEVLRQGLASADHAPVPRAAQAAVIVRSLCSISGMFRERSKTLGSETEMAKKSGWDLLQAGDLQAALELLKQEHRRNPCTGTLVNLGIAHLCLKDPGMARTFFEQAVAEPLPDTGTHALLGVASWILEDRQEAIRIWSKGLDCDYRDEAGGMELPLLLFYAGVREPTLFSIAQAQTLISDALKSRSAKNWPGPLGQFVLGRIDEKRARKAAEFDEPVVTAAQLNQVEFYVGVMAYMRGDQERFIEYVRRCARGRESELNSEWHLAQHEVATYGRNLAKVGQRERT